MTTIQPDKLKFRSIHTGISAALLCFCLAACVFLNGCKKGETVTPADTTTTTTTEKEGFIRGSDLSFLPEMEKAGVKFYNADGQEKDMLTIFSVAGCNTIRLRLWYDPTDGYSGFDEVKTFAQRIHNMGLKVWISIHYSDTWADPANQAKPAAWDSLSFTQLKDSVYQYTSRVVVATQPEYIQIGNEINGGMLWSDGKIQNMSSLVQLIKSGAQAVRDKNSSSKIIIHYAGKASADWFFGQMKSNTVDYDIIGLSYYPVWHGKSLDSLITTVNSLGTDNSKQVVIAETSYPFSLGWNDWTNNIVGLESQLISTYPATQEGQKNYVAEIKRRMKVAPKGIGFCYWGGDWVSFKGSEATDGSTFENQALFDFTNKAVSAMDAFKE